MSEPKWITKTALVLLHAESVSEHGGAEGLRAEGLLESALGRARNLYSCHGVEDVARIAAAYGFGIAQNEPFNDGNMRAAFLAIGVFLERNGYSFYTGKVDSVVKMLGLAAGELGEDELASWVREYMEREPVEGNPSERESSEGELLQLEPLKREPEERETMDREAVEHEALEHEALEHEPMDRTGT